MMRLDKYLSETGFGTRSQVKALLKKGLAAVNGEIIKKPEYKVDETKDQVTCMGKQASYAAFTYLMMNKPPGVVCATKDAKEKTVLELLPAKERKGLFPAGRLDKDTEGLLLLTDDGALAHRLLSPARHVDKTYYARISGEVTEAHQEQFMRGIEIGEKKPTLPATLTIIKSGAKSEVCVTMHEGKFHQIKRMFHAVGCEVIYLKRLSMGALVLDECLKPGEYRHLTKHELDALKENRTDEGR